MSSTYSGDGTVPAATLPWNRRAITGSTNTSPIQVTIPSHGFNTGDTISIEGHLGNAPANGLHSIVRIDANTISLNGTTGAGAGGASGYAFDYEVQPQISLPSDGVDLVNASSVNPAHEAARDVVPYLFKRCGAYSLVGIYEASAVAADPKTAVSGFPITVVGGTTGGVWRDVPGMTSLLTYGGAVPPALVGADGDVLEYHFTFSPRWLVTAPDVYEIGFALGLETNGGAFSEIPTTFTFVQDVTGGSVNTTAPLHLHGTQNGDASSFNFSLRYWLPTTLTNSAELRLFASWDLLVKHYRSNK